jgi:hypothetical protein
MGIAQAGIAFHASNTIEDFERFIASVFGEPATAVPLPVPARFDIRNHSDVMVQVFGDVCFISNDDLAWPLIRDDARSAERLHAALGAPALMMAFCHYDRGGSHGYAIFDKGRRIRTRLQTRPQTDAAALRESGSPLAFEHRRASARRELAVSAHVDDRPSVPPVEPDDARRMVRDGLEALFGVCPWESLMTPTYRFFRLGPDRAALGAPASPPAQAAAAAKRPWWRFA